jgi:hypothetical protein
MIYQLNSEFNALKKLAKKIKKEDNVQEEEIKKDGIEVKYFLKLYPELKDKLVHI